MARASAKGSVIMPPNSEAAPPDTSHRNTMQVLNGSTAPVEKSSVQQIDPKELRRIFRTYDIDGSGEISKGELFKAIKEITKVEPSRAVVASLLGDIDLDESGNIDEDEFVEFFGKLKDLQDMEKELTQRTQRNTLIETLAKVYFTANFCAFFFFVVLWVENNAQKEEGNKTDAQGSSLSMVGFVVTGGSLVMVICGGLLYPLLKLKLAPVFKRERLPLWVQKRLKASSSSSGGGGRQFQSGTTPSALAQAAQKKADEESVSSSSGSFYPAPPPYPPDAGSYRNKAGMEDFPLPPQFDNEALETFVLPDAESEMSSRMSYRREEVAAGLTEWGVYNPSGYAKAQAHFDNIDHCPNFCSFTAKAGASPTSRASPVKSPARPGGIPGAGWAQPAWAQPSPPKTGWAPGSAKRAQPSPPMIGWASQQR